VIGALRITSDTLRVGESRLKVGGVSWISVLPRYRNHGVGRRLIEESIHYLKEHGFHAALCFVQSDLYQRSGFTTAFEERVIQIPVSHEPPKSDAMAYRCRPIKPGDLANIYWIHTDSYRAISCSLLRERAHLSNKWELIRRAQVITDSHGLVQAYFLPSSHGTNLCIQEAGARSREFFPILLAHCNRYARDNMLHQVNYRLPEEHPLNRFLMSRSEGVPGPVLHESVGSLRILDVDETLESMVPEWEFRLEKSLLRELNEEVTLFVDKTPYRIRTHHGVIDIARQSGRNKFSVDHATFTRIITGIVRMSDIFEVSPRLISPEGKALLETIFPSRCPTLNNLDRC
jgi:predicted acetyltransferase